MNIESREKNLKYGVGKRRAKDAVGAASRRVQFGFSLDLILGEASKWRQTKTAGKTWPLCCQNKLYYSFTYYCTILLKLPIFEFYNQTYLFLMLAMLQVVIGLVFVMLLFSLLASTILEFIAGFLSLRGKQLISAIQSMLGGRMSQEFVQHPFFRQLSIGSRERAKVGRSEEALPSYINAGTFSSILLDLLEVDTTEQLEERIDGMEEGVLKKLVRFLYRQSGGDILVFKQKVEGWFNEVMDRASGSYKRSSQRWLFCIGLIVAVIFNADALMIYHNLSVSSTLREVVTEAASNYVNTNPAPQTPNLDSADVNVAREQIDRLVNDNIAVLSSPLGLGWTTVTPGEMNGMWWLYRIVGWLTTALSISFGATFWFEILKKLVNVRAAGPVPAPPPAGMTTFTQTTSPSGQTVTSSSSSILTTRPSDSVLERMAQPRDAAAPPKAHRRRPKKSRSDIPPKADG